MKKYVASQRLHLPQLEKLERHLRTGLSNIAQGEVVYVYEDVDKFVVKGIEIEEPLNPGALNFLTEVATYQEETGTGRTSLTSVEADIATLNTTVAARA